MRSRLFCENKFDSDEWFLVRPSSLITSVKRYNYNSIETYRFCFDGCAVIVFYVPILTVKLKRSVINKDFKTKIPKQRYS